MACPENVGTSTPEHACRKHNSYTREILPFLIVTLADVELVAPSESVTVSLSESKAVDISQ